MRLLETYGFRPAGSISPDAQLRFHLVQEIDDEANYGHYDLITCMEVLEHVVETREVIDRLSRLLTPGGRLIISVPVETGAAAGAETGSSPDRRMARLRRLPVRRALQLGRVIRQSGAGRKQHIPRSIYQDPDGTYFHDHKGFNWRVLQSGLRSGLSYRNGSCILHSAGSRRWRVRFG